MALIPSVPLCYSFAPTPEELVYSYLNPWISGEAPGAAVCFGDFYACDPATLTDRFRDSAHDGIWYFLCVGRRSGLVDDGGVWLAATCRRHFGNGCRRTFVYLDAADNRTGWVMERIESDLEMAGVGAGDGVRVICKVYDAWRRRRFHGVAA